MHPTFRNTCRIASQIFDTSLALAENPARKTRGVFFVAEGASAHIRALVCEATDRPEESCEITEPAGTGSAKPWRSLLPFSDQYSSCVRHIAGRIRSNPDAIFEIRGFDNLNRWEKEALIANLVEGQIGPVFSADRVSLFDATVIVRVNSGFPGQTAAFEAIMKRYQISQEEAARVNFYGCFE